MGLCGGKNKQQSLPTLLDGEKADVAASPKLAESVSPVPIPEKAEPLEGKQNQPSGEDAAPEAPKVSDEEREGDCACCINEGAAREEEQKEEKEEKEDKEKKEEKQEERGAVEVVKQVDEETLAKVTEEGVQKVEIESIAEDRTCCA